MARVVQKQRPVKQKRARGYSLHIRISSEDASFAETGKAIGTLCREHLVPGQVACTTERTNDTEVSKRAETVIRKLLGRPSPWFQSADKKPVRTQTIVLDDKTISRLAERWDASGVAERVIVVPHMFYLPLLRCSIRSLQSNTPELLGQTCLFFDYAELQGTSDLVRQSFLGERAEVLKYTQQAGLPFIDPGRQLFLENIVSLACYMIPAKYLVFKDDDFFLRESKHVDKLLDPLERGYLLSGMYTHGMDRIHTCFFGIRPECLRDELSLFDDGENTYTDTCIDTGSITYRALLQRTKGVFVLADYIENEAGEVICGDTALGRHLTHCASELWFDLPRIMNVHFYRELLSKNVGKTQLNASILLEALAVVFKLEPRGCNYDPADYELRCNAVTDFAAYFAKIYNNYHWLLNQAGAC